MNSVLVSFEEACRLLSGPGSFLVAADERVLRKLPKSDWIGGTIPYFMAHDGGVVTRDHVFVTMLPPYVEMQSVRLFDGADIKDVYSFIPRNGFAIIILPASSPVHLSFAMQAPSYPYFAHRPLVGWVSGVHLDEVGKSKALVLNGKTGQVSDSEAVVAYFDLPEEYGCDVGIVNIFKQGQGPSLRFPDPGFVVKDVIVDGVTANFSEYLIRNQISIRNPLVANYSGAMINVSFQCLDEKNGLVHLYAPVFKGPEYRFAAPVVDYVQEFEGRIPVDANHFLFSCNCILNFIYSELEGKKTGGITGPITFGEVAYQLLNQTLVYLKIVRF